MGWMDAGRQFEEMLAEHMRLRDTRAACVVSLEPLLVSSTNGYETVATGWLSAARQFGPASEQTNHGL